MTLFHTYQWTRCRRPPVLCLCFIFHCQEWKRSHQESHNLCNLVNFPPILLRLLTKIHNVVPADGTVINHNIPGPEGYCIPLQREKAGNNALSLWYIHTSSRISCCGCRYHLSGHKDYPTIVFGYYFNLVSDSSNKLHVYSPILQRAEYMNTEINESSFSFTFSYSLK